MPELIKLPLPIYDQAHPTHGLKAGDIVIDYQNPRSNKFVDKIVAGFQSLWNERGGHHNAEHGALVVEVEGKLKLAHLLTTGFTLEDLNNKRSKHIYRIKNETDRVAIATELNQIIAEKSNFFKKKILWRYFTTLVTFIQRTFNSIGIKNSSLVNNPRVAESDGIGTSSLCTKFVADSMLEATSRVNTSENLGERYMNIYTMTAPKTLQAYLERNLNYETFIVPQAGNQLYEKVKSMIPVTSPTETVHQAIQTFETDQRNHQDSDYEQARKLLQYIYPLLKSHSKIRQELRIYLKSQGMHQEYIRPDNVIESPENINQWLKAKNYNPNEIAMYAIYRQRGLSDAEALFSVRPTLSQWFALHPIRVVVASVLFPVIGTLLAVLIAAISVERANTNRKNFENSPLQGSTVTIFDLMGIQVNNQSTDYQKQPFHSIQLADEIVQTAPEHDDSAVIYNNRHPIFSPNTSCGNNYSAPAQGNNP